MLVIERASRGLLRDIWDCLIDERVSVHPPAIAFNLLAFGVPFLLVLVSALGFFFSDQAARAAVTGFIQSQLPSGLGGPVKTGRVIERLLTPLVEHRKAAAVAGVSFLFITGSALMLSMRLTLNQIFDVPTRRSSLSARIHEIAAFGFVGALVFLGAALVWGLSIVVPFALPLLRFPDAATQAATRWAVAAVLTAGNLGLFYGLYRYLPDEKPTHRTALIASLLCTGLLFAAKGASGMVLRLSFDNYSVIYGAYAAIALGAAWLYYAAFIFTVCAAFGRTLDKSIKFRSRD